VAIDWTGRNLSLKLRDKQGALVRQTSVSFDSLGIQ